MSTELTNEATDLQADRLRAASVPTWLADAPDLIAKAIGEGWNKERCELEPVMHLSNGFGEAG